MNLHAFSLSILWDYFLPQERYMLGSQEYTKQGQKHCSKPWNSYYSPGIQHMPFPKSKLLVKFIWLIDKIEVR